MEVTSQKLRRMQKKVVIIHEDEEEYGVGYGVLISRNGLILTAYHLFKDEDDSERGKSVGSSGGKSVGSKVSVTCNRTGEGTEKFEAVILKLEAKLDLALLQIDVTSNFEYARVAPEVRIGQGVDIIVSDDGDILSYTHGIVAFERRPRKDIARAKKISYIDGETIFVQAHGLHGVPGYSGAPIFDSRCRIVGIYCSGYSRMDLLIHREHLKSFCQPFIQEEEKKKKKKVEEEEVQEEEEEEKKKKKKKKVVEVQEEEMEVKVQVQEEEEKKKKKKKKRKKVVEVQEEEMEVEVQEEEEKKKKVVVEEEEVVEVQEAKEEEKKKERKRKRKRKRKREEEKMRKRKLEDIDAQSETSKVRGKKK